jgi:hypothetical protein
MVSFLDSLVCLVLVAASATAQPVRKLQQNATLVASCAGESLAIVSQGCVDAEACKLAAEEMGLSPGNDKFPFEGEWEDKGCYFFPADHPLYPGEAYFGTGGSCSELRITPQAGALRMSCDGTTLPPFDPTKCPGELCITMEGCQAAALAMGLKLGSPDYPFAGDYPIKGCTYFPATDPLYPGEAYWGSGASICGQLRADPTDGSIRLGCDGAIDLEDPEATEATVETETTEEPVEIEETDAPFETEATDAPFETEATEAPVEAETVVSNQTVSQPVLRPVQTPGVAPTNATEGFNATAPAMAPGEPDEDDEDGKDDKDGKPGSAISSFQNENSAASRTQLGWVLSVFAVISLSLS